MRGGGEFGQGKILCVCVWGGGGWRGTQFTNSRKEGLGGIRVPPTLLFE